MAKLYWIYSGLYYFGIGIGIALKFVFQFAGILLSHNFDTDGDGDTEALGAILPAGIRLLNASRQERKG